MKLYLAGPDVFRVDASAWAQEAQVLCRHYNCEILVPLDGDAVTPLGIYDNNIRMIEAADAVIANLNPFRGTEPDSGTCFEVGYALALGKRVIGYVGDGELLKDRVERLQGKSLQQHNGRDWLDANGMRVEDFDLPLNLMLTSSTSIVIGDLEAALLALMRS
ncbi:MAG TPA: nucleoside 2-deoxyribosyltransferase [Rhodocyclaceae bacterium]|nr:nucleoside 2-deoxyribosyltransferase [Rhodocyclaceae bacterium]